jgi:hypothetical protein
MSGEHDPQRRLWIDANDDISVKVRPYFIGETAGVTPDDVLNRLLKTGWAGSFQNLAKEAVRGVVHRSSKRVFDSGREAVAAAIANRLVAIAKPVLAVKPLDCGDACRQTLPILAIFSTRGSPVADSPHVNVPQSRDVTPLV